MAGTFDFCDTSRVIQEIPPDETSATTFNGWEFVARPSVPYRRAFVVKLFGLKWYMDRSGAKLDVTTDPKHNAGRLLYFYRTNRTWDSFNLNHEYLGVITTRFKSAVTIPTGMPGGTGLIEPFDVQLIHVNPGY